MSLLSYIDFKIHFVLPLPGSENTASQCTVLWNHNLLTYIFRVLRLYLSKATSYCVWSFFWFSTNSPTDISFHAIHYHLSSSADAVYLYQSI